MKRIAPVLVLLAGTMLSGQASAAGFFNLGNLVVAVEGNGSHTGTYSDNQAAPLSLYQYKPTGTSSAAFVNSMMLPQTSSGANFAVSGEYGSSSEGFLQLTGNGKFLTIMGYGVNATAYNNSALGAHQNAASDPTNSKALGQSSSIACGAGCTPVARVVAEIGSNGGVDSSTAVFGVYNGNNPRSVFSADGSSFYLSGQGNSPDQTGGVFQVGKGVTTITSGNFAAHSVTGLDTNANANTQDTRFITGVGGQLYLSVDSKEGDTNRDFIATLGAVGASGPFGNNGPTELTNFATATGKVTLNGNGNGLFASNAKINLSPEEFFFASNKATDDTLYIADSGNPKNDSNKPGTDGGLQKWSLVNGAWQLDYTLSANLNLVKNTAASGTTGLFGLTAEVVDGEVELFATNATVGDTDPTFLFGITDTLAFTKASQAAGEQFSVLATAAADTNFKGVSFAPSAAIPEPGAWALMLTGFGLTGALLRRRRPFAA